MPAGGRTPGKGKSFRFRPGSCKFCLLAGLPPEMGLYASVIPVIVASLLGPSALLLSGPNTAVAVMLGIALLPLAAPGSQDYLVLAATLTAMVGPDALRSRGDATALQHGYIEHTLRFSLGMTIYAGSSEVQRNIIAQRRCGLPRP